MNKSKQTYHYGVDFGGRNCVISEYNGINCQIKENAYSERLTFVGLVTDGIKLYYGRAAKTNLIRLYNNSACELKEYLGKYIVDGLNIQTENYKFYPSEVKIDKNGLCFKLPKLKFNDLNCSDGYFACDTLFVLLMKYLKETMMKEGNEVIICHPCYYNEKQIEYINELYKVCEMKVLKNIPEYLSASLCFGYENNNKLNENEERIVLLLDMGYINCSSTIVKYKKDECEILSHSYNNDKIGGRYIDNLLVNALIGKMGMNIDNISEKLYVKVKEEIIKMKEKLSASGADTIHISIDDGDNDYESDYSVNELNEILKNNGINTKVIDIIKDSIVNSGLIEEEDNKKLEIVIIGGSLRIPLIQKEIENYLKSELDNDINLNRTINMDECMSLGNSYYGLIQSGKWRYSYNEKKIIIHQIESSSRLNNDKCNNTWNVKERISKIYDTIKRICKNESIVQKCASLRNEIEGECYYLQHLLEDNTIINTDENKNEISEVLKRVKSKKLVDNNNYDEIEDLYKRILIKKLNLISEVFRNKYKKESKVSAYLKDINRENKMKNIYIEKIKEKLSIVEDEMRNMNILRGRHKTGGYNSTPSPSNSNNPVPIPVLDNNIILNKRKNSSPVKNIDPPPLPMPQHHQEEIDNLIKELESCINQFPEYPNIRMIKKQIEKIKALPLSSIEYNTQFDKLSSRLENFKIYISDYNNQRNDCIKRITEMICGDGNKNRLNSDDMNRIIRLINDENYHSLQEYKDIISQLTIHKNSRNMINESPPKSSNRDNNIEEGINKVLKQLDDYMKKNPYSPKMKEIKRKMEEANKQNNPVVRFAQLQQILNDLEENDNSYKKNDKNLEIIKHNDNLIMKDHIIKNVILKNDYQKNELHTPKTNQNYIDARCEDGKNRNAIKNDKVIKGLKKRSNTQPNYLKECSPNVDISRKHSEIQALINKLESNMKNYPFYSSIDILKAEINQNKQVPLNDSEYDSQHKKLSKELEKYEKFIIEYNVKQKEKKEKLNNLLVEFNKNSNPELIKEDVIRMAKDMVYKDEQYPLSDYDNVINEMTSIMNIKKNERIVNNGSEMQKIKYNNNQQIEVINKINEDNQNIDKLITIIECFKEIVNKLCRINLQLSDKKEIKNYLKELKDYGDLKNMVYSNVKNLINKTINCLDVIIEEEKNIMTKRSDIIISNLFFIHSMVNNNIIPYEDLHIDKSLICKKTGRLIVGKKLPNNNKINEVYNKVIKLMKQLPVILKENYRESATNKNEIKANNNTIQNNEENNERMRKIIILNERIKGILGYCEKYKHLNEEIEIPVYLKSKISTKISNCDLDRLLNESDDYIKEIDIILDIKRKLINEIHEKLKIVKEELKNDSILRKVKINPDLLNKKTNQLIEGNNLEKYTNQSLHSKIIQLDDLMKEIEKIKNNIKNNLYIKQKKTPRSKNNTPLKANHDEIIKIEIKTPKNDSIKDRIIKNRKISSPSTKFDIIDEIKRHLKYIRLEIKTYHLEDRITIPDILRKRNGDLTIGDELREDSEITLDKKLEAVISLRNDVEGIIQSPKRQKENKSNISEIDVDIDKIKLIDDIKKKILNLEPLLQDVAIKDRVEIPNIIRSFPNKNSLIKGNKLNEKTKEHLQDIYLALNTLLMQVKEMSKKKTTPKNINHNNIKGMYKKRKNTAPY